MKSIDKNVEDLRPVFRHDIKLNSTVKQSNALVEAKYSLSELEQRLVLLFISQLPHNAPDIVRVELPAREVCEALHIMSDKNKYGKIEKILDILMSRVLTIRRERSWYKSHWIQSAMYDAKRQTVTVGFDATLKPDLLNLKCGYVASEAAMIISFSGKYTARMYLLVKQYISAGERTLTIERLTDIFELKDSYTNRISNIKKYIIEPTLTQINDRSDISVEHEYKKESRSIVAVHLFNIKYKSKAPAPGRRPEAGPGPGFEKNNLSVELDEREDSSAISSEIVNSLIAVGVSRRVAENTANKYDNDRIESNISYTKKQKEIQNRAAFCLRAIEDDYAAAARESEQLRKQEREREQQKILERVEAAETMRRIEEEAARRADADSNEKREAPRALHDLLTRMKSRSA